MYLEGYYDIIKQKVISNCETEGKGCLKKVKRFETHLN